jgi:hypothetical protein
MQTVSELSYNKVIDEIRNLDWLNLDEDGMVGVAWAYYYVSIQFRENLQVARQLHPEDEKLRDLEREECNTDNLSPWPGVAQAGEKMDHDEFMKRALALANIPEAKRRRFEEAGGRYLDEMRNMDATSRAMSINSYEDGGLEQVFRAMLSSPKSQDPLLCAFRHFLSEHVRFDSDPTQGHGSMVRHLRPDNRIRPVWVAFRNILIEFVPQLSRPSPAG